MATTMTRDDLIMQLGIGGLEESQQNKILQTIADSVATRIWRKATESLSDEELITLNKMIENKKDDEAEDYIISKIQDYDKFKDDCENEVIEEIIKGVKQSEAAYQNIANQK